jgi:5-methylthioadenosine/S-adenosylhomocysteine deaminase
LVYAGKSTDVTDMMVNGKWVMRKRVIKGVDEKDIFEKSKDYAERIDQFLIKREKSVLSKLIAIGGTSQEESYEVQAKVTIEDPSPVLQKIQGPGMRIIRTRHYHEFDTYFHFKDEADLLRYREDHFIEENGDISNVRTRLTLIQPAREGQYSEDIILSKSRYIAPANQSLRFYKEYFKPAQETEIEKDRLRYLIEFEEEEFFINIDRMDKPPLGLFLEIKARTWSEKDAKDKAGKIVDLLKLLGLGDHKVITQDYIQIIKPKQ